ncbi:plasmid segregation centromere-binding protein ParG [Colwellia chukchiensis]|uniref:Plasmid segregation centromere-binding protein ParG n=1 Tax=Colwellia chukchiensis TaxID=641665 RepID=A0A1H7QU61_9GAMM|nr:hypothetical protein [Colwellia chukchiensis]SEL50837.1 plasmid segregation centromere-binding protein ParG [Colwellia chukchiensis]
MSLSDLKKSKDGPKKKKNFTVDEFIADAENYAKGQPKIVSREHDELTLQQAVVAAKAYADKKKASRAEAGRRFRPATFTLSEEAISQLQALAQDTQLAKSHIIRILIDELCNKDQKEKLTKLLDSDID